MRRYWPDWVPIGEAAEALVVLLEWQEQDAREDLILAVKDRALPIRVILVDPIDGEPIRELENRVDRVLLKPTMLDWSTSIGWLPLVSSKLSQAKVRVEVLSASFESLFFPRPEATEPIATVESTAAAEASEAEPSPRTGRAGRPRKWDWDAIWAELCGHVHEQGLPETQAELVRHILQWSEPKLGGEPPESEVKKRVARIFHRIRLG